MAGDFGRAGEAGIAGKIQGLDRLKKKLRSFPEIVKAEIKTAMEQGAEEIVNLMKSLVAVDSGELRDSIGWTWGDRPKYSQSIGAVKSGDGNMVITIYAGNSKVRYAHLVEFGTSPHINGGMYAGSEHPGTAAKPFFFVSYRALARRAKGRVARAINKAAKRMAAGV